jgi:hypothetical protein
MAFEHFRLCVEAYKIVVRREEIKAFPLLQAHKLLFFIEKSRFLENNIKEEYRLYESSIDNLTQLSRANPHFHSTSPLHLDEKGRKEGRMQVFMRLSQTPESKKQEREEKHQEQMRRTMGKLVREATYEEKLNESIQNCLHKILPNKKQFASGHELLPPKYGYGNWDLGNERICRRP